MQVTRLGKAMLALALAGCLVPTALAGCGTASRAGMTSEELAETYVEILEDRYDEVFPDDRVQTVRISMDEADWEAMQDDVVGKVFYRADISIAGELIEDVAVRTKGSSSLMGAASLPEFRAGIKVDFNFFSAEQNYHSINKMVYNNGFSDPTLMKDFLGCELTALMGIPAPRACFADIWVNNTHVGVYTQVEAIDLNFLVANFHDGYNNLYKPEVRAGALDWTEADAVAETASAEAASASGSSTTTTSQIYHVGGGDLGLIIDRLGDEAGWIPGLSGAGQTTATTGAPAGGGAWMGRLFNYDTGYLTSLGLRTNEDYLDYSRMYELLEVLNSDPAEVSTGDLEGVLDVDEVLRFLAASVVLVHLDNYIGMAHNYYLYEDLGRFSIIPWDLNMSFGGFNSAVSDDQILNFYIDEPTAAPVAEYPLVQQLLDEPEYVEIYHTYLRQMIEGPFSVGRMTARINEIANLIRPYVEEDTTKFSSTAAFEEGLTQTPSSAGSGVMSGGGKFIGLLYFVEQRTASITAQLSGALPSSSGDGSGNGGGKGMAAFGRNQAGGGMMPGGPRPGIAPGGR
jgi:spore coat protein CotH